MTTRLSVDEFDLLNYFGMEPGRLDSDVTWAYNELVYEAVDARAHLSFCIVPSVRDVRILLKVDGVLVYELSAAGVDDVRCHNDEGRESLEVVISARDSVWIRIKPQISINQF
jgi:hypothetical protein